MSASGPSCWSLGTHHTDDTFRVRADDTALRSTLLVLAFGRINSPPAGNISHSAAELPKPHSSDLFAPRSASTLHSTSPRVANTSPKIGHRLVLFFAFWGSEAYSRHAADKHTEISLSNDLRRGLRLLREPIDHHTPLLSEPDRPSRDPLDYGHRALGAHVGAPSS